MGTVGTHLKCIEHNEDTCSERYNEYGSQRNLTAGVKAKIGVKSNRRNNHAMTNHDEPASTHKLRLSFVTISKESDKKKQSRRTTQHRQIKKLCTGEPINAVCVCLDEYSLFEEVIIAEYHKLGYSA